MNRACGFHRMPTEKRCAFGWESIGRPVRIHCTRPAGHGGDHVACSDGGCVIATWPALEVGQDVNARVARLVMLGKVVAA